MMRRIALLSLLLTLTFVGNGYAVQYMPAPPLSQVVTTSVGDVTKGPVTQVPTITWGGDEATYYANGNARETQRGSIFDKEGVRLKLVREDNFVKQVEDYVSGRSPYLRGTLGMITLALDVLNRDPRTSPVFVYQMTESLGDMLVVRDNIKTPKDLCGKTIALQAYGPHVDFMMKIVTDACGSVGKVTIKWTKDLTGTANTPAAALQQDKTVDAVFVIGPDAMKLTNKGTVGTGREESVKGARILLSTKTFDTAIADLYVVRADYFRSNHVDVERFTHGLLVGEEALSQLVKGKATHQKDYNQMVAAMADVLLDDPKGTADGLAGAEGMYEDARFVGYPGNVKFFGDQNYPRNFEKRVNEAQAALISMGLLSKKHSVEHAKWDYKRLAAGLRNTQGVQVPRFDSGEVAKVIDRKQKQGTLSEGELFSFDVFFQPNQNVFSKDQYGADFAKVTEFSSTYGGAVITIEGHSDPLGYLKARKDGQTEEVLRRTMQAAKNLSLSRANAVRDGIIAYAKSKGITLDQSQFVVVGHGIDKPKNGKCGADPCAPKTEKEWRDNMRVEFRVIQIEAESSAFKPL
ncbi:MAG: nitrate ABC transporter substrate-binding protein [Candidatus Sungbacteria bacterium RIFCSPLOWO2_02_FULL_51_17]|nr:MAG: nitrate ABC transporter substrate-binding protein [Candidatus Sungbacteria bacterium RIFCSPLOWO2_02_FULL_51_17]